MGAKGSTMNVPFSIDLTGKVVAVTGAGGVICGCLSEALASTGAKLALINRTAEHAEAAAARVEAAGGSARVYTANVLDRASLEKAHNAMLAELGPCDILINGAGGNSPAATTDAEYEPADSSEPAAGRNFFNLDEAGVRSVFDLNFTGSFITTQIFARDMLGREGCSVLNISSMNAFRPLTKIPAYSAAKAALSNFTQWLAVRLAPSGIRVNAIAPGFFVTGQNRALLFGADGQPSARSRKILAATPMGRFGAVEELIGATFFLISPAASAFVTGVILPVDGGFNAYSGV